MFDLNSLPISGGAFAAGITSVVLFGFVLGPIVADRTIENSGWHKTCETNLRSSVAAQNPKSQSRPKIACGDVMKIFGMVGGAEQLCNQGGNAIFDLMMIDPLAQQKERLRKRQAARLARIADQAPSRCSCASSVVGADRMSWGLFAGSARQFGGPKNLQADLTQALHSPGCARLGGNSERNTQ